jgi:hypothetical protein
MARQADLFAGPRSGCRNVIKSSAELQVWYRDNDRSKEQILRWLVRLESDEPADPRWPHEPKHAQYSIDAHTGDILEIFR